MPVPPHRASGTFLMVPGVQVWAVLLIPRETNQLRFSWTARTGGRLDNLYASYLRFWGKPVGVDGYQLWSPADLGSSPSFPTHLVFFSAEKKVILSRLL